MRNELKQGDIVRVIKRVPRMADSDIVPTEVGIIYSIDKHGKAAVQFPWRTMAYEIPVDSLELVSYGKISAAFSIYDGKYA